MIFVVGSNMGLLPRGVSVGLLYVWSWKGNWDSWLGWFNATLIAAMSA